ncbi:hypothetical protein Clacol_001322 [Clathrus columnatus]|uniref:Zn(2)-C6 fungal-type domain-containing protein n=1 Tax=Clathrus columnatus TaxID=1419009 RepID=A0AAV5A128_9AGAM|nr:hypothetical protein Clacol_001322 [Clathrus columnatus]
MFSTRKTSYQQKIKIEEDAGPSLSTRARDLPRRPVATAEQKSKGDEDDTSFQDRDSPPLPTSSTRKNTSSSKQKIKAEDEGSSLQEQDFSLKRGKACHYKKCDGVRPICGYCAQRDLDCEFDDPASWGKIHFNLHRFSLRLIGFFTKGRERRLALQVRQLTAQLADAQREISLLRQALGYQQQRRQNDPGPANRSYAHPPVPRLSPDDSGQQHTLTGYDADPGGSYYQESVVLSSPSSLQSLGYSDSPSADEGDSYSGAPQASPSPPAQSSSQSRRR